MKFSSYILSAEFHASRQKGGGVWQGLSPALGGAGTAAAQAAVYGRKRRPLSNRCRTLACSILRRIQILNRQ